jgi:hypothetical protein
VFQGEAIQVSLTLVKFDHVIAIAGINGCVTALQFENGVRIRRASHGGTARTSQQQLPLIPGKAKRARRGDRLGKACRSKCPPDVVTLREVVIAEGVVVMATG